MVRSFLAVLALLVLLATLFPLATGAQTDTTRGARLRQNRFQEIKSEKKRVVLKRIETKMAAINKKRTDRWVALLDKLSSFLNSIREKQAAAKSAGRDTASLDVAILAAKSAIDRAKEAVATQAAKQYILEVTDQPTLRQQVGAVMSKLQRDLRDTHKVVVEAKQAVSRAAQERQQTVGEDRR